MQSSAWFPLRRQSVAEARWWVSAELRGAGLEAHIHDASLCISELAANAVGHAESAFRVDLQVADGRIRVAVTDESDLAIDHGAGGRVVGPAEPSGRGLHIVASVARAWGIVERTGGGKTVWYELA